MARVQEKTAAERLSDLSRCLDTAHGFGLRVEPSSLRDVLQDLVFSLDSHDEPGPEHVNPRKREQEKEKDSEASETDPPEQTAKRRRHLEPDPEALRCSARSALPLDPTAAASRPLTAEEEAEEAEKEAALNRIHEIEMFLGVRDDSVRRAATRHPEVAVFLGKLMSAAGSDVKKKPEGGDKIEPNSGWSDYSSECENSGLEVLEAEWEHHWRGM